MPSNRLSPQIRGHSFVHNPSLVSMTQDFPSINGWAKLTRLLPSRPLRIRSRAQPPARPRVVPPSASAGSGMGSDAASTPTHAHADVLRAEARQP